MDDCDLAGRDDAGENLAPRSRGRRSLLRALSGLPLLAFDFRLGKLNAALFSDRPTRLPELIDAHCHLFNVTDLPATRFIYVVVLENYPSETVSQPHGGWLERSIRRIVGLISLRVPTAAQEANFLQTPVQQTTAAPAAAAVSPLVPAEEREIRSLQRDAEREAPPAASLDAAPEAARLCEGRGARRSTNLGTALEWLRLLRSTRARLASELTRLHHLSGHAPSLLCPALVDYSCWLGEQLRSPLPDQVRAMKRLALRPSGPAVHAYVPFDPLRDAMFRRGRAGPDGNWDPVAFVERSLVEDGCIGVKLYPPMGFRPAGNEASRQFYPRHIVDLFGSVQTLGRELDASLARLWALCQRLDAPVMAHGAYSNHAGPGYGARGDPAFWTPVLDPARRQRVLLGHFGRFTTMSAELPHEGDCPAVIPFERTWEAVFARHVQRHPASPVFADISYFSEVFYRSERRRVTAHMARYLEFDPEARHLVFGSDWNVMGIEKRFDDRPGYASRVAAFLTDCGITGEKLARVMHGNAKRFLGLGANDATRARLVRFYTENGQSADRLPQA